MVLCQSCIAVNLVSGYVLKKEYGIVCETAVTPRNCGYEMSFVEAIQGQVWYFSNSSNRQGKVKFTTNVLDFWVCFFELLFYFLNVFWMEYNNELKQLKSEYEVFYYWMPHLKELLDMESFRMAVLQKKKAVATIWKWMCPEQQMWNGIHYLGKGECI